VVVVLRITSCRVYLVDRAVVQRLRAEDHKGQVLELQVKATQGEALLLVVLVVAAVLVR
jgi:hypothetical protein